MVGVSISFAASALLVAFGVYFLVTGNWVLGIAMIAAAVLALVGGIGVLRGFRPIIRKPHDEAAEP
jgi:multisubunit Na+/H+ antiporter MnhC subunit